MIATVAAGCGNGAGAAPKISTTARAGVAPVPPQEGAYFGAWVPPEKGGKGTDEPSAEPSGEPSASPSGALPGEKADKPPMEPVAGFERELGRQLDIVQSYRGWTSDFPAGLEKSVTDSDRHLLLTWGGTDTRKIVQGEHDELIQRRARAVKALGKPIFLRWSRSMDTAQARKRVHSPKAFIAAWKHIRQIFQQEQVHNVAWVWCPSARGFGGAGAFYPGDEHVDWICADAQPGGDYGDLSDSLEPFLRWARERPKPIMIAEFGVPKSYGERRAEWLREAAKTLQDPQVKAVVYFNSDERAENARDRRRSFSVTGDDHAMSALRELATTPYFNPRNLPVMSGG
ncbi:hypothetical protein E1285_20855 [Actinomadura sp. 7K507]|nr:hypothetical protein E1285_20855 [Actinomadura sp. 7K507]